MERLQHTTAKKCENNTDSLGPEHINIHVSRSVSGILFQFTLVSVAKKRTDIALNVGLNDWPILLKEISHQLKEEELNSLMYEITEHVPLNVLVKLFSQVTSKRLHTSATILQSASIEFENQARVASIELHEDILINAYKAIDLIDVERGRLYPSQA